MYRMLLLATAAFLWLPAWGQNPDEADHQALRQLKTDITAAVTKRDFAAVEKVFHRPFMATVVTQESFTDMDGMKKYFDSLFLRSMLRLKDMSIAAEADELSRLYTGTFAITRGATAERYVLADGRSFDMKGRWTAVSLKQADGSWRLLAVHTGVNFLDNPVLNAIEASMLWTMAAALAGGMAAGLLGGWFIWKFRRRR